MTGVSWHPGCPVALDDLRLLTLPHRTFDGGTATGVLVSHHEVADTLVTVFARLHEIGYPVRLMEPVDVYGGDDHASIEADNTSCFNGRPEEGSERWSQHALGWAVDLNPLENPYVYADGTTTHPRSEHYLDRSVRRHPAVLLDGDPAVAAFEDAGWHWGGRWEGPVKDHQHFSRHPLGS